MRKFITLAAAVALLATTVANAQYGPAPPNTPCITWAPLNDIQPTPPPDQVISRPAFVMGCFEQGYIMGCWATDAGTLTWGHHDYTNSSGGNPITSDYCRAFVINSTYPEGVVVFSNTMYIPMVGSKAQSLEWVTVNTGDPVPYNVVQFNDRILATSLSTPSGYCSGVNITGWAEKRADGTFDYVHFSIMDVAVTTATFQVAICHDLTSTTTTATPAPPPTPAPTLPNDKPYIRFANAIPNKKVLTATLTQNGKSKVWSCYPFAKFSEWDIRTFDVGAATLTITACSGGLTLLTTQVTLTPGPLIITMKGGYPLDQYSVETIAASYTPRKLGETGVRLVNLSPDVKAAGLHGNGAVLQNGVPFPVGSRWADISDASPIALDIFNSATGDVLAKATVTPPSSPLVFSAYLLGLSNATTGSPFVTQLVAFVDAPEI